nr:hypothetical protein [uncultured Flavobacterium sp.]
MINFGTLFKDKIINNEILHNGRIIQNYRQTAQMKQGINSANNVLVYSYQHNLYHLEI